MPRLGNTEKTVKMIKIPETCYPFDEVKSSNFRALDLEHPVIEKNLEFDDRIFHNGGDFR
jgi:hypothetical protein